MHRAMVRTAWGAGSTQRWTGRPVAARVSLTYGGALARRTMMSARETTFWLPQEAVALAGGKRTRIGKEVSLSLGSPDV